MNFFFLIFIYWEGYKRVWPLRKDSVGVWSLRAGYGLAVTGPKCWARLGMYYVVGPTQSTVWVHMGTWNVLHVIFAGLSI